MNRCAHCGSRSVYLSEISDMLICRECPGTTIVDSLKYREAAGRFRTLLAEGYFTTKARTTKEKGE